MSGWTRIVRWTSLSPSGSFGFRGMIRPSGNSCWFLPGIGLTSSFMALVLGFVGIDVPGVWVVNHSDLPPAFQPGQGVVYALD